MHVKPPKKTFRSWFFGLTCGLTAWVSTAQPTPPLNPNDFNGGQPPLPPIGTPVDPDLNRPPVGTPPDFPSERPPHNLAPCICGPLVGNYRTGQIEIWHVQAEGGPLELRLTTLTVNSVDPQTTIVDVYDRTNLINSVTVAYTGAEAAFNGIGWEKFADVALGTHPAGKSLRLEARNGGTPMTQTHYWLKLCGARWMAIDSPSFHCLEEDHAAWRFRVQAGEPLILDLDNVGIPGPATDINWRLIDPTGTLISRGVQPIVAGVEFNLPTPMAGLWTLEMKPVGGEHYLIDKKGGADRHIYLDWHTSQRGRKRVEIVLDTLPALGVPFDVELFRRRSFGAGFTNDLIAKQISTNGYADFKHLPNGFYDVVVTPKDPGILPVPAQLDLILCDQPVTNRFIFKGQKVEPEINRPPSLEAIAPKVVSEGATLALTLVGSDLDVPPQRLIYSLSTGPTGLTVSGRGALAWTPTEAQGPSVNTVRVKVSDGAASVTNTFTVTVTEVNVAPIFAVVTPKTGAELVTLAVTLRATDNDVPARTLTYSLVSGPAGLKVSSSGALAWTPTEAQGPSVNTVRVKVSDGTASVTNTFTVTVTEVNMAPIFALVTPKTGAELATLAVTLRATDSDVPAQPLTYSLVSGPAGLKVSSSGALAWTPTEAQGPSVNIVRVKVSDGAASVTNTLTVTVTEVNVAPIFAVVTPKTVAQLALLSVSLSASDTDLPLQSLTYSLVSGEFPTGMTLTGTTLTWTPTEAQGPSTNSVAVKVSDGVASVTNRFTVEVKP